MTQKIRQIFILIDKSKNPPEKRALSRHRELQIKFHLCIIFETNEKKTKK